MAKSLWDDYDYEGNGPEKAKKPRGPRPNKKWWQADESADEPQRIIGFNSQWVEDDRAGQEYGGFGYSGPVYGADDAFDDADDRWYRRNSFRYGKQADYSPSSLFRSAFSRASFSYYGSGDAEAQNKAIRALRNLTRSANTIVDKTTGSKSEYAVQFSKGTVSNGVDAALNENKQRIVFVSPDELLDTKDTESEDAVVDALTGFVLLRVQMAQDVDADVIRAVNATNLKHAYFRAAEMLTLEKVPLHNIDAKKFAANVADNYLAGLLTKSLLTRLARRKVVANWGGFAPYFIRHAKKFAAVREHLEVATQSVESIVGKLGYNMLADESQIELPEAVNEIAAKHLGAELAPELILPACRALVADIRKLLETATSEDGTPKEYTPGDIESQLAEAMTAMQEAQNGTKKGGKNPLEEILNSVGAGMGAAMSAQLEVTKSSGNKSIENSALAEKMRQNVSLAQMIRDLESMEKALNEAKNNVENGRPNAKEQQAAAIRSLAYCASSRPAANEALAKNGKAEFDAFTDLAHKLSGQGVAVDAKEAEQMAKLCEQLAKKAKEINKQQLRENKAQATAALDATNADMQKAVNLFADVAAKLAAERQKQLDFLASQAAEDCPPVIRDEANAAATLLEKMAYKVNAFIARVKESMERLAAERKSIANTRSPAPAHRSFATSWQQAARALGCVDSCFNNNWEWHTSPTMEKMLRKAVDNLDDVADDRMTVHDATKDAVSAAIAGAATNDISFLAQFIDTVMANKVSELVESRDKITGAAKTWGVDERALTQLVNALQSMATYHKSAPVAVSIGKELSGAIDKFTTESSPVDEQLFGEKIAAKTTVLDGDAIGRMNDEARNAPEEDFVAYLHGNSAKPKVETQREPRRRGTSEDVVRLVKRKNRSAIENIRNALQFQAGKRTVETYGLLSGDLDEGSLHKLGYDCEHIWAQKTLSKLPDVAVGVLVDQSGSMCGKKIENAREICITLAEALRKIAGVRLYVYGHTANTHSRDDLTIYEHYRPEMGENFTNLGNISAHSNNYDGYAIKDVAKRLSADVAKKKYLFVIADGLPSGSGYGGDNATKHVTSVCKFTRDRLKIGTYAFAVGVPPYSQNSFKQQYGEKHVVFVNDLTKCLPQIVRFLRNAMQQERKLVGVED